MAFSFCNLSTSTRNGACGSGDWPLPPAAASTASGLDTPCTASHTFAGVRFPPGSCVLDGASLRPVAGGWHTCHRRPAAAALQPCGHTTPTAQHERLLFNNVAPIEAWLRTSMRCVHRRPSRLPQLRRHLSYWCLGLVGPENQTSCSTSFVAGWARDPRAVEWWCLRGAAPHRRAQRRHRRSSHSETPSHCSCGDTPSSSSSDTQSQHNVHTGYYIIVSRMSGLVPAAGGQEVYCKAWTPGRPASAQFGRRQAS